MSDIVKEKITSPLGELMYVNISGTGKLDYDGKFYEYTAGIKLDKKSAKTMYSEICNFFEEHKPAWFKGDEPSNKIKRKQDDGTFLFQFKTHAEFEDKAGNTKQTKIGIVNSKNKYVELPDGEGIGNGSTGKISGVMTIHSDKRGKTAGVSLWLNNVQLLKYIKYVPDTGFDEADGEFKDFETADTDDFKKKKKKKKKKSKKDVDSSEIPF